ncbi:MAG: M28 family peptidase [Myxococcota bacterium]|nr:M28 family peptidase [Myxococcota bacterium]
MSSPISPNLERIETDIITLTQSYGPRPHGSQAARLAAMYVRNQLIDAGWEPQFIHLAENIVSCKGMGTHLFLAHTDSVAQSPGVIDNAVGVSILLEIARQTTEPDLCLGFPAAEELGFIGSKYLSNQLHKWHPNPDELKLVMALDLTGYGSLSITGLGPLWNTSRLQWLYAHTQPHSPYAYQVVSNAFPHMERSDHGPFAAKGILSAHLLGRGPSGVFPEYHQANDRYYNIDAIAETFEALLAITEAEETVPDHQSILEPGLVFGQHVVPGWMVWTVLIFGIASGIWEFRQFKKLIPMLIHGLIATMFASIPMIVLTHGYFFEPSPAEITAQNVNGMPATGWWMGSTWVSLAGAVAWIAWRQKRQIRGPGALLSSLFTVGGLLFSPLFAFPFAIAAILHRLTPIAALLPAAYWLQPAILRELTFHGLVPPIFWGLFWLMAMPAIVVNSKDSPDA